MEEYILLKLRLVNRKVNLLVIFERIDGQ
jgi:hypothetical protein